MKRRKCSCGDDAYKVIYRATAESTNDSLVEYCCYPCIPRLLEIVKNSLTFWASIDSVWSEDLSYYDLYELDDDVKVD